jgi:hypothetical protein
VLADAEWSQWSDRKIAEVCGVTHPFVANIRAPKVITVITPKAENEPGEVVTVTTQPAKKTVVDRNPITPTPAPSPAEDFGPSAEEIAEAQREQEAEFAAFRLVLDADDKLAAAVAEVKRLGALNRVLEERINGLMNEKNAALQAAKSWQRKAERAERAMKAAA